ncbi:MAG: cupin domain-containing protein [Gammaproteobacteria bacterium]|nr:cupin domain-containing protein [Gammaproteobacteria bacterium]MDD9963816.1 cupin domain-containing protein [Gammaproteobacteria bacterium]MDE0273794.1 cupin domain-containing protein [Gammaproteobacteria bacterium]
MALTRDIKVTVQERLQRDPFFREALLKEAADCLLVSDVETDKSGCPYHVRHGVDEMFVILEGQGRYRFGDATYEVPANDVLGAPRGRAEFAHKLTNTGATPLKYLAISSVATNDVLEYPDSGKLMAVSDFGTDAEGFHFIGRANTACGYWDNEPDSAD